MPLGDRIQCRDTAANNTSKQLKPLSVWASQRSTIRVDGAVFYLSVSLSINSAPNWSPSRKALR